MEETRKKMRERNEYIYCMYENFITSFEVVLYMKNQEELKKYEKIMSLRKNNLLYNVSKIFLETHCTLMYYLVEENASLSIYKTDAIELRKKEKTHCETVYNSLVRIRRRRDLIFGLHNIHNVDIISWCICQEYIDNLHTTLTLEEVLAFINKKIENKTDSEILIFGIEEQQKRKHKMKRV